MPKKTVPVSVRLSPEDADFIAKLDIDDATTPSDKLRAIIVDARKRKLGTEDYPGSLKLSQDFVAPTLRIIRASENSHHLHSELVSRMGEWVPECMAYLVASNGPEMELDAEQLMEIERDLADRVVVLMQSVLQMAITRRGPLYEPEALRARMQPVLELAEVILQKK
ncbi:MAG: hypothetical protein KJO38_02945 [Gammaproteobacteria bacterium]|nr:hypothetical protein [Gammaproteobacteria bacterium]